jgi:lysophospholipase L1-like esterase
MALRILSLGDSYTIGEGVAEAGRWPMQLVARLRDRGIPCADPRIIARTGWTTDELDVAITQAGPIGLFDLVTLLIGVNNQYRGRSLEEYREQFRALLEQAIAFARGRPERVLVLSIPDWGVTPFAEGRDSGRIANEINAFNTANRAETLAVGARYVDITPSTRDLSEPGLLAEDGLHPSGLLYKRWVDLALPTVLQSLDGNT